MWPRGVGVLVAPTGILNILRPLVLDRVEMVGFGAFFTFFVDEGFFFYP